MESMVTMLKGDMIDPDDREQRLRMTAEQIADRGITDPNLLEAFRQVPRHQFVQPEHQSEAYDDGPLPIGHGQTISQPYTVATMIDALKVKASDRALEIGTGSGYAAAILGQLAGQVVSVERIPELATRAKETLEGLEIQNVTVACADGTQGFVENGPYDVILVSAGGPQIPQSLVEQLRLGGRMVIPVGPTLSNQNLIKVVRVSQHDYTKEVIAKVRFVPLIGSEGWDG